MRRGSVLAILEGRVPEVAGRYGVTSLRLFGSVARNNATPSSDVDFLVRFGSPTFANYIGLKLDLEDMLGNPVELVNPDKVPDPLWPEIEAEAVTLV